MSLKAFYQTFYQNEQLFRLEDQPFPAVMRLQPSDNVVLVESLVKAPALKPVLIVEPVVVAPPIPKEKIIVDKAPTPELPNPVPVIAVVPVDAPKPVELPQSPSIPEPKSGGVVLQKIPPVAQINHKVLILADEELSPSELLFLEKVLKAVNLNIDGVELLNLHGVTHIDFAEVLRGKYINHFITFGVPFQRINLDIMMDRYSPVRFEGITFLMADSLPTIEADQNLKRALWNSLKRVFSLS